MNKNINTAILATLLLIGAIALNSLDHRGLDGVAAMFLFGSAYHYTFLVFNALINKAEDGSGK